MHPPPPSDSTELAECPAARSGSRRRKRREKESLEIYFLYQGYSNVERAARINAVGTDDGPLHRQSFAHSFLAEKEFLFKSVDQRACD